MSDRIIRLGGSNIGNARSVKNLKEFLNPSDDRNYIVFSAVPEIMDIIESEIGQVFQKSLNTAGTCKKLNAVFTEKAGSSPSENYIQLSEQLVSILNGIAIIGDYSEALKDQVLSFSEKLSAEILRVQWHSEENRARVVLPEDFDLRTNADFGNATFISLNKSKLSGYKNGVFLVSK